MHIEAESWVRRLVILGGAALLGLLSASVALANPGDWRVAVRDHADNVNFLARDVRRELVHVASHSCLFGQMLAEVGRLEGQAAVLRGWSRHQAPLQLERKVHEIAAHSNHLQSLIEEAWQRGQRGLHAPLLCTRRLQGWMAQVDAEIFAAYNAIPGVRIAFSHPQPCGHWGVVPRPLAAVGFRELDFGQDRGWSAGGRVERELSWPTERGWEREFSQNNGFGPGFRVEVSGFRLEQPGIRLETGGGMGVVRGGNQRGGERGAVSRHGVGRRHADRTVERR
jgi:hypothetical protein